MPRYRVTVVDDVTVIELDGLVASRRFWWMGVVDALVLRGSRDFVVSLKGARLRSLADDRFVREVAAHIQGTGGRVVFVPPPGRRAAARIHTLARTSHALSAPDVEAAMATISVPRKG